MYLFYVHLFLTLQGIISYFFITLRFVSYVVSPQICFNPFLPAGAEPGAGGASARGKGQHPQGRPAYPAAHGHAPSSRPEQAVHRRNPACRRRGHRPAR